MNSKMQVEGGEYYEDGYIYGKPETNEQTLCLKNKQSTGFRTDL